MCFVTLSLSFPLSSLSSPSKTPPWSALSLCLIISPIIIIFTIKNTTMKCFVTLSYHFPYHHYLHHQKHHHEVLCHFVLSFPLSSLSSPSKTPPWSALSLYHFNHLHHHHHHTHQLHHILTSSCSRMMLKLSVSFTLSSQTARPPSAHFASSSSLRPSLRIIIISTTITPFLLITFHRCCSSTIVKCSLSAWLCCLRNITIITNITISSTLHIQYHRLMAHWLMVQPIK